jgi:hypothetical protein
MCETENVTNSHMLITFELSGETVVTYLELTPELSTYNTHIHIVSYMAYGSNCKLEWLVVKSFCFAKDEICILCCFIDDAFWKFVCLVIVMNGLLSHPVNSSLVQLLVFLSVCLVIVMNGLLSHPVNSSLVQLLVFLSVCRGANSLWRKLNG